MTVFQRVALLGKGSLGTVLLDQLLKANFTVTVLTRSASSATSLPPRVALEQVDYTSIESLKTALTGHDIVISTLSPTAIPLQKPIIDAAIAVGVKRFIPAEFGAMTSDPAEAGLTEYTVFGVGAFMEMLFTTPLVVDIEHREVRLFDGGSHPFSTSRLETVARAVVASLYNPDETRNRVVRVHDAVLTQRKLLGIAKMWTSGFEWKNVDVDAQAEVDGLLVQLEKGFNPALAPGLFAAALMSGRYGGEYKKVDNELLGLGFMSEKEIEQFGSKLRGK
ncbi:hypothetical protein BDW71DRAFT_207350 [Aspergillus fruticulosus]